ncbi:hypothetical protein SERLA73DRAFT_173597 [Serpula lacrymans var. lacrymans S7.3]|uniref:Uncharacterized protein n=2 Tax=Serpula lacrymans var. lacrymans TaxID=341189 RepID=F8PEW5_SERL3|nr:uncharacterized protein SERLADRAFT_454380 [Serpula lacrymans var. lacrymans S7.9]EGO04176.1 hypothetical protein SERLA73DRAFT_173597 [Serpula lacrymans var. lacrymans S7.3]EGO30120.1 hypothetical protein SERLADRAFT_454380 [Serpula lacrymans var. lacrymans S7.9]
MKICTRGRLLLRTKRWSSQRLSFSMDRQSQTSKRVLCPLYLGRLLSAFILPIFILRCFDSQQGNHLVLL